MVYNVCGKLANFLFFILNLGLIVVGVIITWYSIWMVLHQFEVTVARTSLVNLLSVDNIECFYVYRTISIMIGGCMVVLGFCGCFAVGFGSKTALSVHLVLVFIVFVVKIVAIVMFLANNDHLRREFVGVYRDELVANYHNNSRTKNTLDWVHTSLKCCGANGCEDFLPAGNFPTSCECGTKNAVVRMEGCALITWAVFEDGTLQVAFLGLICMLIELGLMIFAAIVIDRIRREPCVIQKVG
ncbi:Tetraspanin [Caenorhabditis elegans]|uniref:Tetraspanin n=1 Tax=Caenorhabditis elegans TaxID=6239 RepID=O62466_CAEEL|nr:Tetraspanin [Caenorhabditis elegans]CAA16352.4 Tetraspanin [Caenorhabditis elegans]|eukprot:NP_502621.3 Tetraspanin [Caenorhabditis elegans]